MTNPAIPIICLATILHYNKLSRKNIGTMNKKTIIDQLISIIDTNTRITETQRDALKEAVAKLSTSISTDEFIELIKILGALLLFKHPS